MLRCESGEVERIVFSDEKLFVIEEELNAQNDRVYVVTIDDIPQQIGAIQRFQKPRSMMICEIVSLITDFCRNQE